MEGNQGFASTPFALSDDAPQCDMILKGGVTSGVVYPRAILEVARKYRLRSIGGTSAGAIAAGFAAAAEYARRNGDPGGYDRLDKCCVELPDILAGLFQPATHLRSLLQAGLGLTAAKNKLRGFLWPLRWILASGAGLGAAVYAGLLAITDLLTAAPVWSPAAIPGLVLAVVVGAVVHLALRLGLMVFSDLRRQNYGLCSGMPVGAAKSPALTEWLHTSLQFIAFGDKPPDRPLTLRDLEGGGQFPGLEIDFRTITTNLSMQQPEVISRTRLSLFFDPEQWGQLFPADVMSYLKTGKPSSSAPHLRRLPKGLDLPVLVVIRMSLSFPFLIQAVPLWIRDAGLKGASRPFSQIWFSDGGITSNFPIHFFDELLPSRPTFAFSLDDRPDTFTTTDRISMPQNARDGSILPIHRIETLANFAGALLGSAKGWQDQMQSVLPGQRQRVVRIKLDKATEGGLNINMSRETSERLMGYGAEAGQMACQKFDFAEHRWRRALVAHEQLEVLTNTLHKAWPAYGVWYSGYIEHVQSYGESVDFASREEIGRRLWSLSAASVDLGPPLKVKYPRPPARLRTTPEL